MAVHIMLVNDDGITSPALAALCMAAANRGHHVTVCAPQTQQSAKSHAFTLNTPLFVRPYSMPGAAAAYAIEGTPVDCARLGMLNLCNPKPDLVMSGINYGYNVGLATFVSGTVGAAREAAFHGIPAMAVSMYYVTPEETMHFFADWAVRLGERLVDYPAPAQSVCSINVPPLPVAELKPAQMCGICRNVYRDGYEERLSPRGDRYFWLKPEEEDEQPTPGTDVDLLQKGHITVTFLTPEGCRQQDHADFVSSLR